MTDALHGFYMGALDAELACAPATPFSARMASYHCRMLLALEMTPQDGTPDVNVEGPGRPSNTSTEGQL